MFSFLFIYLFIYLCVFNSTLSVLQDLKIEKAKPKANELFNFQ